MLAGLQAGLQAGLGLPALPWEAQRQRAGAHQLTPGAYAANQKGAALLAYRLGLSWQTLSASPSAKALRPISELQIDSLCFTVLSRERAAAG